jgi:hypothetical protein
LNRVANSAVTFKCYPSKFPEGFSHEFADGYVLMTVDAKKSLVDFKFYDVDPETHETTLDGSHGIYKITGKAGGTGVVADYYKIELKDGKDVFDTMYLEKTLLEPKSDKSGIIGQYTFAGHGYAYDWNICYYAQ